MWPTLREYLTFLCDVYYSKVPNIYELICGAFRNSYIKLKSKLLIIKAYTLKGYLVIVASPKNITILATYFVITPKHMASCTEADSGNNSLNQVR